MLTIHSAVANVIREKTDLTLWCNSPLQGKDLRNQQKYGQAELPDWCHANHCSISLYPCIIISSNHHNIISGPASYFQNIDSSLLYCYIQQNDCRKAIFSKNRSEEGNVLVWHFLAREPFVDLFKFLSMLSGDFSFWSLICSLEDDWILFFRQTKKRHT